MATIWFVLVALMLVAYVVLDGFDLGTGAIHPFVGRTQRERSLVIHTVGPVWDGNEVWLIAAGGALYFAFPMLYASAFSGFYLSLMIVLWLLIWRGIGIELRSHFDHPLWQQFFDFLFWVSSALLAIFFGVAIGNVIRGVPLNPDGYFFEPLWTDFRVGPSPGILDWYTVLTGLVALVSLTVHGANWVALKTIGDVQTRAHRIAAVGWAPLVLVTILSLVATVYVRPQMLDNYRAHALAWIVPVVVLLSLFATAWFRWRRMDLYAFLATSILISSMLAGAAVGLYPVLLPASTNPAYTLTIENTKSGAYSLRVGLLWWIAGIMLAIGYFTFLYRFFRGKVGEPGVHIPEVSEGRSGS
jgi:cytochrome d ubiquinol oxidase subunit II